MSIVAETAQVREALTPRRAAVAAGALGLATLFGMALGSMPGLTRSAPPARIAEVAQPAPAAPSTAEEQARQAALQQLARAMLKKSLADQAVAMTTTGANASAALADKAETIATTRTSAGAQVAAPLPTPPASGQTAALDPQDMERLAGKAAEAIRNGDIASARLVLEHAARAGDATALYALAETYDPRVLVKLRVQGMQGEPDTARNLYQRALDNGVEEARSRL